MTLETVPVDGLAGLRQRGFEFMSNVAERATVGPSSTTFAHVAVGRPNLVKVLGRLERQTRLRVDNIQQVWRFAPYRDTAPLDQRTGARGIVSTTVVPRQALRIYPLLANDVPEGLVGETPAVFILVDERLVVLAGPHTSDGQSTLWVTTDSWFVRRAVNLRDDSLHTARPVADLQTPLTPRQFEIAQALCVGVADATTARRLRISTRSVERETALVLHHVGARSRVEAATKIMGSDFFRRPLIRTGQSPARARAEG